MKKHISLLTAMLLVMLLLLTGCGKDAPRPEPSETVENMPGPESDGAESRYIGIIFNDPESSKEFWLAIDDAGNVLNAACSGWIAEFDPEACRGHYLEAFSTLYEQFDGKSCPSIGFGFAGMAPEKEGGFRAECEKFISGLRPDLPFETGTEDPERVTQKFEDYQALKKKSDAPEEVAEQPGSEGESTAASMEAGTAEEFLKALTNAAEIILQKDLTADISNIRIPDVTADRIDCNGHALTLLGTYAAEDHYRLVEVINASRIDISGLDVDSGRLSSVNEEMEPNQYKVEELFRFNTSYKNVILGILPERKNITGNPVTAESYVYINDDGTEVIVSVRRAQTVEARHRQEMDYLETYLEDPDAFFIDGRDGRKKIYTDIELYFDDFDTPTDQQIMLSVAKTGSLKLSGKINVTGPRVIIESVTKGSVDISGLTVNRECMSPDCMAVSCDEGIDEALLTPSGGLKNNSGGKLVVSISEHQSAITVW